MEAAVRDGSYLAVSESAPLLPVRAASSIATLGPVVPPRNRPLRVLFMAASPEGVEPFLSFEAEEAGILEATADTGTELVVEESGTVEGLRFTAETGRPRVLRCPSSKPATPQWMRGQPVFLVENELGGPALAMRTDRTGVYGAGPRLVFVSGSRTRALGMAGRSPR